MDFGVGCQRNSLLTVQYIYGTDDMPMIESTGHKPTEQERAIEAVRVALIRIRQQVNAALVAVDEIKSNTEVRG